MPLTNEAINTRVQILTTEEVRTAIKYYLESQGSRNLPEDDSWLLTFEDKDTANKTSEENFATITWTPVEYG